MVIPKIWTFDLEYGNLKSVDLWFRNIVIQKVWTFDLKYDNFKKI